MVIGIRPTVDFAFKQILGNPDHPAVTIHFLNAILGDRPRITNVEFLNPFLERESESDKLSVLDVLAVDEHGRKLNIEMQTTIPLGMTQRLTYHVSRLYASQMTERMQYHRLHPAINICVLTKSLFPAIPGLHLDFRLREATGRLLTDDLQVHLLELPKLRLTAENIRQASRLEQWCYFLLHAHELTLNDVERLFPDHEFAEAAGVLEMISRTDAEQILYDARLKFQLDQEANLEGARREGLLVGEEIGIRKGELRGRIGLLRQLLGVMATDDLSNYTEDQLSTIENDLQAQLRNRGQ